LERGRTGRSVRGSGWARNSDWRLVRLSFLLSSFRYRPSSASPFPPVFGTDFPHSLPSVSSWAEQARYLHRQHRLVYTLLSRVRLLLQRFFRFLPSHAHSPHPTDKLYACAAVGHQAIDLYEDDFLHYLSITPGANKDNLWEVSRSPSSLSHCLRARILTLHALLLLTTSSPSSFFQPNPIHLHAAKKIGDLCASMGIVLPLSPARLFVFSSSPTPLPPFLRSSSIADRLTLPLSKQTGNGRAIAVSLAQAGADSAFSFFFGAFCFDVTLLLLR
jgi:hypothetical protein